MSNAHHGDEDSDEDRVVYLDYDQSAQDQGANRGNWGNGAPNSREKKPVKFKPLFQQKRYKGDLEKERYIDNIDEVLWEGKKNGEQPNDCDGFGDGDVYHEVASPPPIRSAVPPATARGSSSAKKTLSPGFKRSFTAMASPAERSPAPVSPVTPYITASSSSTKPPLRANVEAESRGRVDVGEDRPTHWNRMRPNVPAKTSKVTSNKAAPKNPKLISNIKPTKLAQIPKPKALPSQPAPLSFSENSRPSFRPSWLTSQPSGPGTSGSSQSQTYRTQRLGTPAAEERLLIEAIQEEEDVPLVAGGGGAGGGSASYSATFRPPPQRGHPQDDDAHMGGGGFDEPAHVHDMISSSTELQARHPVTHVSLVSPQRALTVHSLSTPHNAFSAHSPALPAGHDGSGSKLVRGHSVHGGRAAGTSKARPGSLKAKLHKVWRDTDANENRIINIPVDPLSAKSRALDLQDPRSRAVHYVDAQIVEVLPDQAPFKVALLSVLGTWQKRSVEVEVEQVANGASIVGFFKPDTCVGQGRNLEESAILRVYEPQLLRGCCVSGHYTNQADYVMINTNCWELADTT